MQVPQQTEEESCGHKMLHNINKICNQRNIESIANEEMASEGNTLEIAEILKGKQQGITRGEDERRGERASVEKRVREKDGKGETGAEKKGTRDVRKIIKKREEIERKEKKEKTEKKK